MSWNYSTSLASDKDKIRLYIGDTISDIPLLSDEEINAEFALNDSDIFRTAESLCRSLSARFGREAIIEIKDVLRDEKLMQAGHFLKLADRFGGLATHSVSWTGTYNSTVDSPTFTRTLGDK